MIISLIFKNIFTIDLYYGRITSVSLVTIFNWSNFCKTFEHTWNILDYPKEKWNGLL